MPSPYFAHAPAKVNLFLHVTGRRETGYHDLDSWVVFSNQSGDRVHYTPSGSADFTLDIDGPYADALAAFDVKDNLIIRAAELFQRHIGQATGGHTYLQKNLPIAAGIGGGSSDAAAIIHALCAAHNMDTAPAGLQQDLAALGADIPACLQGYGLRMQGVGDVIKPAPKLGFPLYAVLLNPNVPCPTPPIFKALDIAQCQNSTIDLPDHFNDFDSCIRFLSQHSRNDLAPPARGLIPDIDMALTLLQQQKGCALSRMSGSGASIFGLFAEMHAAEMAVSAIKSAHPSWWVEASQLI